MDSESVQITPEMIAAGLGVYLGWITDDAPRWPQGEANLMAQIFRAMRRLTPPMASSIDGTGGRLEERGKASTLSLSDALFILSNFAASSVEARAEVKQFLYQGPCFNRYQNRKTTGRTRNVLVAMKPSDAVLDFLIALARDGKIDSVGKPG